MIKKLGVVMDDITHINYAKDSTLALLSAAQARNYQLFYMNSNDLYWQSGQACALASPLKVFADNKRWFLKEEASPITLAELDIILMRKDPPFDQEYLYATYLLEQAMNAGVLVVNNPRAIRDANEKLYLSWFPNCAPNTLVTSKISLIREFLHVEQDIILKPLDQMGGRGIFRIQAGDMNTSVILETATSNQTRTIMVQRYIPEIAQGDKRIILIGGQAVPYALVRTPLPGELRGNMAAGGTISGAQLTARDRYLCEQVGPTLLEKGLWFVGLDVIGEYITEINVTSPTGIRELNRMFNLSIADDFFDFLHQL